MSFERLPSTYGLGRMRASKEFIRLHESEKAKLRKVVLYISKAFLNRMNNPEAVVFYVDKEAKKLRVMPAEASEQDARKVLRPKGSTLNAGQLSGGRMLKEILGCTDGVYYWDTKNNWFDMTEPSEKI